MKEKIGFFGGSFNPPTIAHIELAKKAMKECNLNKIIFVPVGDHYEKDGLIPVYHRIEMLKEICRNEKGLEVSDIESKINKKLFAVDVFELINNKYEESDNFFIMGSDNYVNIKDWHHSEKLLNNYSYIVLKRNTSDKYNLEKKFDEKNLKTSNVYKIIENNKTNKISSTEARKMVKNENALKEILLPQTILYIRENNLYKLSK